MEDRYVLMPNGRIIEFSVEFRKRAIGGGWRPDHVQECLTCGALVTYDDEAMSRHSEWHRSSLTASKMADAIEGAAASAGLRNRATP